MQRARAVLAATRLADELGAPLAGVLERIAFAVAADEEADGERRAALAGPRSTAQVLAWLPLLGVALGALLGADPVAVVLSGGLGTASAVLGVTMLLLGRWWTAALLTRAGRAGDERTSTTRSGALLDAASRTCAAFTGASRAGGASPADPSRARASRAGVPRTDASHAGASRAGASRARATRSTVAQPTPPANERDARWTRGARRPLVGCGDQPVVVEALCRGLPGNERSRMILRWCPG